MAIKKIELGWITVSDLTKSKKFFTETLGLQLKTSDDTYGWLELQGKDGGTYLGVGKSNEQESHKPGQNAVLTFVVDDIVKTKKEFETKGVKFLGDIMEVPGHVKLATFVDPDNNTFQLVETLNTK